MADHDPNNHSGDTIDPVFPASAIGAPHPSLGHRPREGVQTIQRAESPAYSRAPR